jgi:hypothetical protein
MIHVATVHWRTGRWIDLQFRYFERFMPSPFRVYAFLDQVSVAHREKLFSTPTEPIEDHPTKLNVLGELISLAAEDPSDPIVFVDSDAFPVAPIGPLLEEHLDRHRLIAVQRYENCGDLQPHPCFCITTVGLWQEVGGDWHRGARWVNSEGRRITDVGGNLLAALERAGVDWYPLRRVNSTDVDPLHFALYGDTEHGPLVYHHGAGSRDGTGGRATVYARKAAKRTPRARMAKRVPKVGPLRGLRRRLDPSANLRKNQIDHLRELSDEVFVDIGRDEEFWRRFA